MDVIVAKSAGFCFGVKRAVDTAYKEIKENENKKIYTFGPIIHNDEVIKDMKNHGVEVLHTPEELRSLTDGIVIIRSHGVGKHVYDELEKYNIIIKARNREEACIKLYNQHSLPIYIHSIKEGI